MRCIVDAGATWVDQEVVLCRARPEVMITSRGQQDLPAFCRALTGVFAASNLAGTRAITRCCFPRLSN